MPTESRVYWKIENDGRVLLKYFTLFSNYIQVKIGDSQIAQDCPFALELHNDDPVQAPQEYVIKAKAKILVILKDLVDEDALKSELDRLLPD